MSLAASTASFLSPILDRIDPDSQTQNAFRQGGRVIALHTSDVTASTNQPHGRIFF